MLIKGNDYCLGCFAIKDGATICPLCGWHDDMAMFAEHCLTPGFLLYDRYLIGHLLELGERHTTYLAFDTQDGVKVVLKAYSADGNPDNDYYEITHYIGNAESIEKLMDYRSEPPLEHEPLPPPASPAPAVSQAPPPAKITSVSRKRLLRYALCAAAVVIFVVSGLIAVRMLNGGPDIVADVAGSAPSPEPAPTPTIIAEPIGSDVAIELQTPQPVTPAPVTRTPLAAEWSDWQEAYAEYADKPGYLTERRTEYRSAPVEYIDSEWSAWDSKSSSGSGIVQESEYRTRTRVKKYFDVPSVDGWTSTGNTVMQPTAWSAWSEKEAFPADNVEVETREITEQRYVTLYRYQRYLTKSADDTGNKDTAYDPGGGEYQSTDWMDKPLVSLGSDSYGTLMRDGVGVWFREESIRSDEGVQTITQYRYRVTQEKYEFTGWSEWSDWRKGTPPKSVADTEVEARYRFKTRADRLGAWSEWQETIIKSGDKLKVETRVLYRYKPQ